MRVEKFVFDGSQGDRLSARLDLPEHEPSTFALFAHCFTCSKDVVAASRISRGLVGLGVGVLRFDFTGLGESEGEFTNTSFSSNVHDLVRAAAALRARRRPPRLLIGHSLGGAAALVAAGEIPEVGGIVTINAPFDVSHVTQLFPRAVDDIGRTGEAEVEIAGRRFRVTREFLVDAAAQNMEASLDRLRKALLVFHAPADQVVGIGHARRIFEAARHPKSFVALDGADHLLTNEADAVYVAGVVAAWARRYLEGTATATRLQAPPDAEPRTVHVSETGRGRFTQRIEMGRHMVYSDEPPGVGDDLGPTPYELLLASLGACTAMTLRLYADRKGLPLERVAVHLRHSRIHADDCLECQERPASIDRLERVLDLSGGLTVEQRRHLVEIAERCPVHRTLTGDKEIVTRLTDGDPG